MVEFNGFNLDLRFNYEGRYGRRYDAALCCTQSTMQELVDTCLEELEQHWLAGELTTMEHWAVDLCQTIIKAAGRGAIDNCGKYDVLFGLSFSDMGTIEELKSQDCEDED